jgi:hypothetical protein
LYRNGRCDHDEDGGDKRSFFNSKLSTGLDCNHTCERCRNNTAWTDNGQENAFANG